MGIPERRVFGRGLSSPGYVAASKAITPSSKNSPNKGKSIVHVRSMNNREQFIKLVLSMDLSALERNYLEKVITKHLEKHGMLTIDLPKQLPLKYDSHEQFMETYLPLIYHDCWAQVVEDYSQLEVKPLKKLYITKVYQVGLYLNIELRCLIPKFDTHTSQFFLHNWLTFLQPEGSQSGRKTFAFVNAYYKVNKKLQMPEHLLPVLKRPDRAENYLVQMEYTVRVLMPNNAVWKLFTRGQTVTLTPIYYLQPTLRQANTLSLLSSRDNFTETVLQPEGEVYELDTERAEDFRLYGKKKFNEEQKKAIIACYNAVDLHQHEESKVVMIQGPPGTGKTHTLVGIVKNLMVNCLFDNLSKPMRILICAPSNGAVDNIALRLIADRSFLATYPEKGVKEVKLLRIGQRDKLHPKVLPYHLEHQLDKRFPPMMEPFPLKEWKKAREGLLLEAHIILSTLNSVQVASMANLFQDSSPDLRFRCVIIDEAGQSTEPELLMPLVYPTSKLILIGDHLQLPATVISSFAQGKNYGRSMLERSCKHFQALCDAGGDDDQQKILEQLPMLTLKQQFRMRPEIVAFPSAQFYGGQLQTPARTGENAAIPLKPYVVFDVTDSQEKKGSGGKNKGFALPSMSKYNLEEAAFVMTLLRAIFARLGYPNLNKRKPMTTGKGALKVKIGVITFYQGQKEELTRLLRRFLGGFLLKFVDVNTVDGFQGQERDIVVLSCVRAFDPFHYERNKKHSVGFLRSPQRMNVALTRAKSALFVAINAASFAGVSPWQQLLDDAQQRDCLERLTSQVSTGDLQKKI